MKLDGDNRPLTDYLHQFVYFFLGGVGTSDMWHVTVVLRSPIGNLDRFLGKKVSSEGTFFWLELQKQQNQFWNPHCLNFTIGWVQDGQMDLNSNKKYVS